MDKQTEAMKLHLANDLLKYAELVEDEALISPEEMNCASLMRLAAEALAQPEQFPFKQLEEELTKIAELQDHIRLLEKQLAQPEQEPVGQLLEDAFGRGQVMWFNKPKDESMLYTTPPQRTWERPWVSLTDDEIMNMFIYEPSILQVARAVEAKLKEKNNGSR